MTVYYKDLGGGWFTFSGYDDFDNEFSTHYYGPTLRKAIKLFKHSHKPLLKRKIRLIQGEL